MTDFSTQTEVNVESNDAETKKMLEKLYYQVNVQLGGTGIQTNLCDDDYDNAFDIAVQTYRTGSTRSTNETFGFLTLETNRVKYVLNERVDNVWEIYRSRGFVGGLGGVGSFESFGAATTNILLRGGLHQHSANVDLASFDFLLQYQETLNRLFAREIQFVYHEHSSELLILQVPRFEEVVGLKLSILKSFKELLQDRFAYKWLREYTLAVAKTIQGEKYSKFSTMPGAQGGTVLKGEQLKQAGVEEMLKLEQDLLDFDDAGGIPQPIRG